MLFDFNNPFGEIKSSQKRVFYCEDPTANPFVTMEPRLPMRYEVDPSISYRMGSECFSKRDFSEPLFASLEDPHV